MNNGRMSHQEFLRLSAYRYAALHKPSAAKKVVSKRRVRAERGWRKQTNAANHAKGETFKVTDRESVMPAKPHKLPYLHVAQF